MNCFRKTAHLRGSTLVFSLIVLTFLLVSAISLATVAVTEKRAVLSSVKSNLSFQVADSGAEVILVGIKEGDAFNTTIPLPTTPKVTISDFFGTCGDQAAKTVRGGDTDSGIYDVTFYDGRDPAGQLGCSDNRADVAKIISKGMYVGTTRAIEVGIPPAPLP